MGLQLDDVVFGQNLYYLPIVAAAALCPNAESPASELPLPATLNTDVSDRKLQNGTFTEAREPAKWN